jgi:hypothetical protein
LRALPPTDTSIAHPPVSGKVSPLKISPCRSADPLPGKNNFRFARRFPLMYNTGRPPVAPDMAGQPTLRTGIFL